MNDRFSNRSHRKNLHVSKKDLPRICLPVALVFGSFAVREIFYDDPMVKKLLGGANLLFFWAICVFAAWRIDSWLSKNIPSGNEYENLRSGEPYEWKKMARIAFFVVFALSLFWLLVHFFGFLEAHFVWLILGGLLWLLGLLLDRRGRKDA